MNIWDCPKCKEEQIEDDISRLRADGICQRHHIKMNQTSVSLHEYCIITDISKDFDFVNAMIELKQKDIIEYNMKLAQFKQSAPQPIKKKEENKPYCPSCKSTNIRKISTMNRAVSVGIFGLASGKIGKSMECLNCGYKW